MSESELQNENYIKSKYIDKALYFDETKNFLKYLKIVHSVEDELIFDKSFTFVTSFDDFKIKILEIIFRTKGEILNQLTDFLSNFKIESEGIIFSASLMDKIKYSDIRNILLELELISIHSNNNSYILNNKYVDNYIKNIDQTTLSLEAFKKKQNAQDELGLLAEKAVIDFERKRLTNISIMFGDIEHTSQKNVSAGYDIKSIENYLDDNLNKITRFIEVKTVSLSEFNFYWSRNEIDKARIIGERYYLYLLPVKYQNTFDFENILIINDPFQNVYLNNNDWIKQEETISIRKKSK